MAKVQLKNYMIGAHIHVWCDSHVKAESLEQAAALAQKLEIGDFVEVIAGAYNDGRLEIIQVYDEDSTL